MDPHWVLSAVLLGIAAMYGLALYSEAHAIPGSDKRTVRSRIPRYGEAVANFRRNDNTARQTSWAGRSEQRYSPLKR